jgi:hypothetical protein
MKLILFFIQEKSWLVSVLTTLIPTNINLIQYWKILSILISRFLYKLFKILFPHHWIITMYLVTLSRLMRQQISLHFTDTLATSYERLFSLSTWRVHLGTSKASTCLGWHISRGSIKWVYQLEFFYFTNCKFSSFSVFDILSSPKKFGFNS